jgi:hypothetical protein
MNTLNLLWSVNDNGKCFTTLTLGLKFIHLTATYACTDNTVTWTTGAGPANRLGFQDDTEFRLLQALVYYWSCHSKPAFVKF